jgi:two-component system sensor histidine kinase AlgZ
MPVSSDKARPSTEMLMPDCCNIGVIFRVLLLVNGVSLAAALLQAASAQAALQTFVEASILIESASLSSLLVLCGVRRLLLNASPIPQRLACALVPALVTGALIHLLNAGEQTFGTLTGVAPVEGMLAAGAFGALMQHYFELRARAFSPALSEARLQALQARIRPHFLFNSLNAVLSLIRTEPRRAESALEDLSDLFRVLMRDSRDITTLADEIRLCKQYLSIEKIRLGERLQVEWNTEQVSDDILVKAEIPSLLLQPLLENAVHYGVEPAREPVLVTIRVTRSLDRIEIAVINPIPILMTGDRAPTPGNHMALDNIRQRLALLHDVEAQLTIAETRGFFEVHLRFPYVKAA